MNGARKTGVAACSALVLILPASATGQQQRVWADAPVEERAILEGDVSSPLLNPQLFDAGQRIAAVFDYGDYAVKAVSLETGDVVWQKGQRGQGPGEFANPMDVVVGKADSVWVLDPANRRISVFGPDGSQGRTIRADQESYHRFALSRDGFYAARSDVQLGLVAKLAPDLALVGDMGVPTWVPELTYFSSELRMGADADGSLVVVAFRYTGRILLNDRDKKNLREVVAVATADEPEEIVLTPPGGGVARRLAPNTRSLVREVAVDGNDVYVLSFSESDEDDWISNAVDVYAADTGYRHSLRLNRPASGIAVRNGRIVLLETDLLPRITEIQVKRNNLDRSESP